MLSLHKFLFESMLNRRILRIQAFKAIYSYAENPAMTLKEAESRLDRSCEATRDLYLYMLSIIGPLTAEASSRIEAARAKFNPTDEERNPNLKFVNNAIAPIFAQDPDFTKLIAKKKFSWEQNDVLLRKLYEKIREREYFKNYMASEESSLEEDAALWIKIFSREFEDNAELWEILEDKSIDWTDNLPYALIWCNRTIDELGRGARWNLPALYQSDLPGNAGKESDKAFVTNLLRKAFLRFGDYYQMVSDCTPKWDKNRICVTDLALIVCGLAEAEAFPLMPGKIIINEYVEISKYYSTPESRAFVNGVLDKLINKK